MYSRPSGHTVPNRTPSRATSDPSRACSPAAGESVCRTGSTPSGRRTCPAPYARRWHRPGPRCCHRGPHPAPELGRCRRPCQPDQDAEAPDVRPRWLLAPAQARSPRFVRAALRSGTSTVLGSADGRRGQRRVGRRHQLSGVVGKAQASGNGPTPLVPPPRHRDRPGRRPAGRADAASTTRTATHTNGPRSGRALALETRFGPAPPCAGVGGSVDRRVSRLSTALRALSALRVRAGWVMPANRPSTKVTGSAPAWPVRAGSPGRRRRIRRHLPGRRRDISVAPLYSHWTVRAVCCRMALGSSLRMPRTEAGTTALAGRPRSGQGYRRWCGCCAGAGHGTAPARRHGPLRAARPVQWRCRSR
ncbi:hypothetical protein SCANM63S_06311 [Streptomyces canarius]